MRTNNNNTATQTFANNKKQLFQELMNATQSRKSEPACPPPMPARAASKVAPAPAEAKSAALLRQLHRIVCNQAWSLRHVQEPVVEHRIVVGAKKPAKAEQKKIKVMCASTARQFPFRHVETRVKTSPVVGVREAWARLTLRAISRGEFELKPTRANTEARKVATMIPKDSVQLNHVQTRVTTTPIVGVRDGLTSLALRAISRGEFVLKPAVANTKARKATATTPKGPQLMSRMRDGWARAISSGEFELKPAPEMRVTHAVVVLVGDEKAPVADEKAPATESNAAILRRHAPLLAQLAESGADAFEAVRLFGALDENSRQLVIALLKL